MNQDEILTVVTDVVRPFVKKGVPFDADSLLLEHKLLDSLNVVQVVLALERRLGRSIGPEDLSFDHFVTCRHLAAALGAKSSSKY